MRDAVLQIKVNDCAIIKCDNLYYQNVTMIHYNWMRNKMQQQLRLWSLASNEESFEFCFKIRKDFSMVKKSKAKILDLSKNL